MVDFEIKAYAMQILAEHGCNEYTYGGEQSKYLLDDLKEEYPNGMKYSYVDVANAILSISRPMLIERKKYLVLWDTPNACDGFYEDNFEVAKERALDIMIDWLLYEQMDMSNPPTQNDIDDFNQMIYDCEAYVQIYCEDTDTYEDYWTPSDEDLLSIGWKSIEEEITEC